MLKKENKKDKKMKILHDKNCKILLEEEEAELKEEEEAELKVFNMNGKRKNKWEYGIRQLH